MSCSVDKAVKLWLPRYVSDLSRDALAGLPVATSAVELKGRRAARHAWKNLVLPGQSELMTC